MYKGRDLRIRLNEKTIFHATECSFSSSMAIDSVATKDTVGEVGTPSNLSWSVSSNGLVANTPAGSTTTQGVKPLLDAHKAGTRIPVEFTTENDGDVIITGFGYIESLEIQAPVSGNATLSISVKGDGDYTVETIAD